jgi:hypothetical protein
MVLKSSRALPPRRRTFGGWRRTPGVRHRNLNSEGAWWGIVMLLVFGTYLVYRFFG